MTDSEIIRAKELLEKIKHAYSAQLVEIERLRNSNKKLEEKLIKQQYINNMLSESVKETQAEAYKEFAETLVNRCKEIIEEEWNKKVAPVSWADAYEQFIDDIDNLVKELVGENQ